MSQRWPAARVDSLGLQDDKGSVFAMQGWTKANKRINLIKQETETDENGREISIHDLARLS